MALELNAACPSFDLPGTDDRTHSLSDSKEKLLVVIVSCNHCPYVIAYEPRIVALANEYMARGVGFLAINANDATRYPDDGMQPMKARARERRSTSSTKRASSATTGESTTTTATQRASRRTISRARSTRCSPATSRPPPRRWRSAAA